MLAKAMCRGWAGKHRDGAADLALTAVRLCSALGITLLRAVCIVLVGCWVRSLLGLWVKDCEW
jgi:hypothetical protein